MSGNGLNSGYIGVDQKKSQSGAYDSRKHYLERTLGQFEHAQYWTPAGNITTSWWLDANDTNTINLVNGSAQLWIDKTNNGRIAIQGTSASRPQLRTTPWSSNRGLYVLSFDGLDDVLTGPTANSIITNTSYSSFVVGRARTVSTNSGNGFENEGFYGDTAGIVSLFLRSNNTAGAYNWDGNNDVVATPYTINTPAMFYAELSGGFIRVRVNAGTEVSASSGTTGAASVMQIGRVWNTNTLCLDGEIAEIIFTSTALTSTNRELVEGYLAWKWGLESNLPVSHPYKNTPPLP